MTLTKQQAIQALKNNQFIGFTTNTGNVLIKKANRTDYNIYIYEEGTDEPSHYIGSITNVMATLSDKNSKQDFIVVEK